jgi:hypothetical protein
MLDAHRWLDDAIALRRLRDLLPSLGARKQCIVLVGPVFHLPVEIERDAGRVVLALPNAAELAHLFARVLEQGEANADSEVLGQAIRGALGLSSGEAVRVLRKALRTRARSTRARSARSCARSAARCIARLHSPSSTTRPASATSAGSASSRAGSPSAGARSRTRR